MAWFNPPIPDIIQGIIQEWKDMHPDWEVRVWTECDPLMEPEYREIYDSLEYYCSKSDILSYWLLWKYGGVWSDTDAVPVRRLDPLCNLKGFVGRQYDRKIACGFMGAEQKSPMMKYILTLCRQKFIKIPGRGRCKYGPHLLSSKSVMMRYKSNRYKICPCHYFYITRDRKKCWEWFQKDPVGRKMWMEDKMKKGWMPDRVMPYSVHLWGIDGSSDRKA